MAYINGQEVNDAIIVKGGGITPTGTINITENGTYDVAEYGTANVNVSVNNLVADITTTEAQRIIEIPISAEVQQAKHLAIVLENLVMSANDWLYIEDVPNIPNDRTHYLFGSKYTDFTLNAAITMSKQQDGTYKMFMLRGTSADSYDLSTNNKIYFICYGNTTTFNAGAKIKVYAAF